MNHSYILRNEDRVMRPVTVEDAEFIVRLRAQNHARGCVHDTSYDVEKQRRWIHDYLKRENEYYWIIETLDGRPIGTESFYNYNAAKNEIESGRWVMMQNERINIVASRIQWFDFAFNILGVGRVVFDVVLTNKNVIRYQEMCGAVRTGKIESIDGVGGGRVNVICFAQDASEWKKVKSRLARFCRRLSEAKIIRRSIDGSGKVVDEVIFVN